MKAYSYLLLAAAILLNSCQKNNNDESRVNLGQVYFGLSTFFNRTTFYSVDLATQHVNWQTPEIFGSNNPPSIDSGIVYTSDEYGASAMKLSTGEVVWMSAYSSENFRNNDFQYTSYPIIKDSLIYCSGFTGVQGSPAVYCLSKKTGGIIWSSPLGNELIDHVYQVPPPAVAGSYVVIAGTNYDNQNKLVCHNRFTGKLNWVKDLKTIGITPAMYLQADGTNIYFSDKKKPMVHCFDAVTGNKKWSVNLPNIVFDLERMNLEGNNLIAASELALYIIDKSTGTLINTIESTDGFYSVRVENSKIYTGQSGGKISKFDMSGQREWVCETPLKSVADSLINAQEIPISHLAQLVTARDHVVIGFSLETPMKCIVSGFYVVDKSSGKLLKQPSNCDGLFPFNYSHIVDGKSYYPNQGG